VVKVIWHNATLAPQTDGSVVFARWRQCASHLAQSTSQTAGQSVQPFLHSSRQRVPILYNWPYLPPSILLLRKRDLDPYLIRTSLGPPNSASQTASQSVQPFYTAYGRASLYFTMSHPSPLKISHLHRGMWTPTWYIVSWAHLSP